MNAPLTHLPAYLGLYAALMLGVICNLFLDIQYGSFGFEVIIWAILLGWTTLVGWRQLGEASAGGQQKQKIVLLLGFVLFFLVFLPGWGFPRAGLYLLVILQAAQNCVTTTRRQLHLGLLVSAVMVIFAAAHYRADWTMLFYLIPYIVAVVFTLVSEQISRRAQDLRLTSLGNPNHAGQGTAIAAATALILGLTAALYLATPQLSWPYIQWLYGQPSELGFLGKSNQKGHQPGSGNPSGAGDQSGDAAGSGDAPYELSPGRGWPTPAEMREAAKRPGMPAWQSATIMQMAGLDEAISGALAPLKQAITDAWDALKAWFEENRTAALLSLFALLFLLMLFGLSVLLREARAVIWLRVRFDYLQLITFSRYADGTTGAIQFYRAMERLFMFRETVRQPTANTREFLREATYYRDNIRAEASEMTRLFEQYRYGPIAPNPVQLSQMQRLYRAMFHKMG